MNKNFGISFIILITLALMLVACGGRSGAETQAGSVAQAAEPTEQPATPIEVATAETGDISLVYPYTGNLQPKDEVNLTPSLTGKVENLLVEVGDEVKAGDVIATIGRDKFITQVRQAQAGLTEAQLNLAKMKQGKRPEEIAVAEAAVELARSALADVATIDDNERTRSSAALARAQAELEKAQSEYDKIAWAGDVGSTPQALALEQATVSYQDALAKYELETNPSDSTLAPLMLQLAQAELNLVLAKEPFRKIDFDLAQVAIERAQAALELANLQLDDTSIEAPFDGVIAELYIDEGSLVGPQTPIALYVSKDVEVEIEVEESRIGQISQGQSVVLQSTAYPGQDFPAAVTSIAPIADQDTRTFTVKITPVDGDHQLKGGMFANVSLLAEERTDTTLVPRSAVTQINDQETVYVVNGNTVEQRPVTTGLVDEDQIEILSGVEPGETVVIAGQPNLTDGAKVEAVNKL